MQKVKDIRVYLKSCLAAQYPDAELRGFNNWILEYLFGFTSTDALLNADKPLSAKNSLDLESIISELKQEKPIQQILGYSWFYGHKFLINKFVLIPRPETEELVDWILKDAPNKKTILDVGTGSGCIPITLSLNSTAKVSSLDVSKKALLQAKINTKTLKASVHFIEADVLTIDCLNQLGFYDIMVSNPPYVLESDKKMMAKNVLDNEPHIALFVPNNDALKFYIAIADIASKRLNPNGFLYFEIHENYGVATLEMLKAKGFTALELRKDLQGKDRMVKAVWKS